MNNFAIIANQHCLEMVRTLDGRKWKTKRKKAPNTEKEQPNFSRLPDVAATPLMPALLPIPLSSLPKSDKKYIENLVRNESCQLDGNDSWLKIV